MAVQRRKNLGKSLIYSVEPIPLEKNGPGDIKQIEAATRSRSPVMTLTKLTRKGHVRVQCPMLAPFILTLFSVKPED